MKVKPHWQILSSLILATITGLIFRNLAANGGQSEGFANGVVSFSADVGRLFLNLLKMIIVPLIVSSVISGITSLHGMKGFGRLLGKTAGFYALTSLLAICLGLILVNVIQPGLTNGKPNEAILLAFEDHKENVAGEAALEKVQEAKGIGDEQGGIVKQLTGFFMRMVPTNVFAAAINNGQMLGLIFFSLLFSIAMTRLPLQQVSPIRDIFVSLNDVMIVLTQWIMALAPIGVFALLLPARGSVIAIVRVVVADAVHVRVFVRVLLAQHLRDERGGRRVGLRGHGSRGVATARAGLPRDRRFTGRRDSDDAHFEIFARLDSRQLGADDGSERPIRNRCGSPEARFSTAFFLETRPVTGKAPRARARGETEKRRTGDGRAACTLAR